MQVERFLFVEACVTKRSGEMEGRNTWEGSRLARSASSRGKARAPECEFACHSAPLFLGPATTLTSTCNAYCALSMCRAKKKSNPPVIRHCWGRGESRAFPKMA
jgi:hypothetical protein